MRPMLGDLSGLESSVAVSVVAFLGVCAKPTPEKHQFGVWGLGFRV